MRSLWVILMVVFLISVTIGCQAVAGSSTFISSNSTQNGNVLHLNVTQPQDESIIRSNPIVVSGSTLPGAEVLINGFWVAIENGRFSTMVQLEPGPNSIDISVSDSSGKQNSKSISVIYVP